MKMIKNIFTHIIVLVSLLVAVESDQVANEKFSFIKEIYSESWALVIGINTYQNVEPLNYAVNDAVAVKEMLVEKYGFKESNIRLILDEEATKDNILAGFSDILAQAREKDRVVVFYAGHGETYKLPSGGDMGYLIPVDGNLDNLYLSSIPMKSVYDIADMSYAKHILYLVDACYGGLTLNTRGLKKNTTPEYLKKMTRERGRQVITAGGKDEQVQERPEWGHSAFTRNLLKGLGDGLADENLDGVITGDELGGFIKNRVIVDVDGAHTPQKGRIGSEMGEFVFISETLDEAFADAADASFEDEQIDNLESEVAELKKLLKTQPQNRSSYKTVNPKTAATLSWVFPGAGHYYSGKIGKGIVYTGLELMSLLALSGFSKDYNLKNDEYLIAVENLNSASTQEKYNKYKSEANTFLKDKNSAQIGMITAGTAALGIWIWNTRDIKKVNAKYSYSPKVSFGFNPLGQVTATIKF